MLKYETTSQAGQEQMFLITHWPALGLFVLFICHKSKFIFSEEEKKKTPRNLVALKYCRLVRF